MNILEELQKINAVYTDKHFIYASGKHGSGYINMDPIFPHVGLVGELCKQLGEAFKGEFDTVAAPATGGIVLAVLTAYTAHTDGHPVMGVWADKDGKGGFDFEREGFKDHINGKRVLIVEDLLTTGDSVEKVCREVEKQGGKLVGVSVVCNRGGVTADNLKAPRLEALTNVKIEAYDPEACELCKESIPIVDDIGHGDDYKETHPDYAGGYISLQG
jgi:orotate phosphoribosyltransferase